MKAGPNGPADSCLALGVPRCVFGSPIERWQRATLGVLRVFSYQRAKAASGWMRAVTGT